MLRLRSARERRMEGIHRMKKHTRRAAAVGAGVALAMTSLATSVSAHDGRDDWRWQDDYKQRTLASGLTSPLLGLAVDREGTAYVSHMLTGSITAIDRSGTPSEVVTAPGTSATGVAAGRHGSLAWIEQSESGGQPVGSLKVRAWDGTVTTVTDQLAQYEILNNPDGLVEYGFTDLPAACKAQFPPPPDPNTPPDPNAPPPPSPEPELGDVNPNPFALAVAGHGAYYVADAGGNTILRVSESGEISTVAILPPVPFTVTSEVAAGMGLPACTVGAEYLFHPVPTDVEVGDDGMLYVSSLPGGPEDASFGRRGGVFRVNPWNGRVREVATGFLGAVDLALDDDGDIYVAELFGGSISKVTRRGEARKVLDIASPGAIEYFRGRLYVTSGNGFPDFGQPNGSVVRIRL